ncbi:MAG: TOMM precursor leader peptide-binding protein [Pseudonocardiaceae bacterium]
MTDTLDNLAALDVAPARPGDAPIALLGSGLLHSALATSLVGNCRLIAVDDLAEDTSVAAAGCAALVVASDADDPRPYPALQRYAAQRGMPWLPVRVEGGWVLVGPAVLPPDPGCPTCVARRRRGNRSDSKAREILHRHYGADIADTPSVLVTPLVANTVTALVTDELDRLRKDQASARTRGALLCVSLRSAAVARHLVLADPLCPHCAALPEDNPAAARIQPRRLPKRDPSLLRVGELGSRQAELERLYVDTETGVLASLGSTSRGASPVAVARLAPARAGHDSQHGYGRADDFHSATLTAVTEALERLAGTHPRGRRTAMRAAYVDVAGQAIDPRTLGLYPDSWYEQPGFRFARFQPDRETWWVWGYSFARAEPVLVPQSFAYYGPGRKDDPGFAYECSNGCALGGCLEEAILYGLLEVAERDAFLMTWYARMPVPRVDLRSAGDRRIPLTAELIRQRHGYEVMAFATTLEQHVPAFWTMAVDCVGGPGRPRVYCGAAAHPDAERALRCALRELGPGVAGLQQRYDPDTAARLLADSELVGEMDDHAMLYGHPDAGQRLRFLPADEPARPLSSLADQWAWPRYGDLGEDLAELVGRYLATGLDVIAVDTTSPEHRAGDFACAKVIVPGTLPMTFGHRYRRTHGLRRLATVPGLLGLGTTELRPEDLNPLPHPFP